MAAPLRLASRSLTEADYQVKLADLPTSQIAKRGD
jgi:hypothetical protein